MMRVVTGLLITAAAMYAFACLVLFLSQRSLIFYPQPRRAGLDAAIMKLPVDGVQLNVSTRQLEVPEAVMYFGGNAEDVSGSLPDLAAAFPQHALYLMHYRGYGGSGGKPGQAALFADALALFDQVSAQHPKVTVIGRSLGSGVAVYLASARPVARLVLVTPYDSMADLGAQQFPLFPVRWLMRDKFESWRYAPQVKVPTTLVTAENDGVIPRASTDLLLTRFTPGVAHQVVIPGTGHNTVSNHPSYAQALSSPRQESNLRQ
jgi:pimeloyl-ACP methyl ester carboxylesterase